MSQHELDDFPVIHKGKMRSGSQEATTGGVPLDGLGMTPIERMFWDAAHKSDLLYSGDPDYAKLDIIDFPRTEIDDRNVYLLQRGIKIDAYRPDFIASMACADHSFSVIVECDGHDFHDRSKDQVSRDKARDRKLLNFAPTLRFSGSEIFRDAMECWAEVAVFLAQKSVAGVREKRRMYLDGLFRPWLQQILDGKQSVHSGLCLANLISARLVQSQIGSSTTIPVDMLKTLGLTEASFAHFMSDARNIVTWTYNSAGFCRFTLVAPVDPIPSSALHISGETDVVQTGAHHAS